ncbi:YbgC/FadM family acyl-CoA thioesterase [Polynucleobacter sp. AP-Reno-20A-A9]|uniref:YbgC/FadM family acyl-CoA thioesterase n=1 Tax=Polynucleobacter sp. AP-Reno-20A-A9 TaxID=2576925 RepID=UPI001C0E5FC1|nr:YbgC/FadM family acyl-CoA thioesterase [Polynucleobacter sp. AP-Reno-20A-A9]MBU3628043.1 YbgC/FadM family acyl-CoA thioesterase [Polynucleobacter sp. AP-Reno-20A-A9]
MTTIHNPNPAVSTYTHRVCYSDTDAAGFVYHGRYLEIFERSRAEWLAQRGLSPTKLVNELNIVMPVRELTMNFYKPGRLDDILYIDQVIEHRGRTQISVKQTAQRKVLGSDDLETIASAVLHIVCVDTNTLKPKAWPDGLFLAE